MIYYRSLLCLFSFWWKELLLQEPSCNMIILPHTSRGQFLQELEPEHEFMQELELGQELGLAKDLQEGSEELSKVDPLKSLDNSKIKLLYCRCTKATIM